jgi:DNA polymerase V
MAIGDQSIALIDCNNFYVSCERVFNPALEGKPVLVLSNNDGCVIARSQEVKDLGVKMGVAWSSVQPWAKRDNIIALSSNYTLYADMSNRVMKVISEFSPDQEVYSIDESFINLTGFKHLNLIDYGMTIQSKVKKLVGLPVCVGIGASKTLAKLANHIAKKQPTFDGVCDLNTLQADDLNSLFVKIKVGEVWGVGGRTEKKLGELGMNTVLDLKQASPKRIRKQFSVVMERTVMELNGQSCIALEEVAPPKEQLMCSRSFGVPVSTLPELIESVITYTTRVAEKLRRQRSVASSIHVFINTNPFKTKEPQYSGGLLVPLPEPTDDTRLLIAAALAGLKSIYRVGFAYKKSGVMLAELSFADQQQKGLFYNTEMQTRSKSLMGAIDRINSLMGSGTIKFLGEGLDKKWKPKSERKTPCYTTNMDEIPVVWAH